MAHALTPSADGSLSPLIFYYFDLIGSDSFRNLTAERFRQAGCLRPIDFREWNCYDELPEEDGDLYMYDGIVLSALAAKDLIRPVPDSIPADGAGGIFPWVTDLGKYRNRLFGLPVMMCSNALFCRKKDDQHVRSIMELDEPVAIPVQSMLMFYFIQAVCRNRSLHKSMEIMDHILDLIGGRDYLEESSHTDYDGIDRFNREECRYFLGYTEDMRYLKEDDYVVCFERFANSRRSGKNYYMADYISLGKNVPKEKLQDSVTLMKILTEEQFTYEVCTMGGQLQYFLPANRKVFPRLAVFDPLYDHLYDMLEYGDNSILRYGRNYYEDFEKHEEYLFRFLYEKAGWKTDGLDLEETAERMLSEVHEIHRERFRRFVSHACGRRRPASAPPRTMLKDMLHDGLHPTTN